MRCCKRRPVLCGRGDPISRGLILSRHAVIQSKNHAKSKPAHTGIGRGGSPEPAGVIEVNPSTLLRRLRLNLESDAHLLESDCRLSVVNCS